MRINRYLAAASSLSRRAADIAIASGRVTVNGRPAVIGLDIDPGASVHLDGLPLSLTSTFTYLKLNKPVGYVSSRSRQGKDPTIYDLLPAEFARLRTAGRLDRDSSGLMIVSDDGDFIQRHTHPSHHKLKIYELTYTRPLTSDDRTRLETGIDLPDGISRIKVIEARGGSATISISEGRNRQLRRTFGALGLGITRLHRTAIGTIRLGALKSGEWTQFTPDKSA